MEKILGDGFRDNGTVGEIVAQDYRTAEVFEQFGIDFYCGGGLNIAEACLNKKMTIRKLESALLEIDLTNDPQVHINYSEWSVDMLIDHIVGHHHRHIRAYIPFMQKYLAKMVAVYGDDNPDILRLDTLFSKLSKSLIKNMDKEEQLLFPFIKKLDDSGTIGTPGDYTAFFALDRPVQLMNIDHELAGRLMKGITGLCRSLTSSVKSYNTWNVCHAKLQEFEEELKMHIHLENNILFPKSLELEKILYRIRTIN